MKDEIIKLAGSVVQHGKLSDRVYLMKLNGADADAAVEATEKLASENNYSKICAKVPKRASAPFYARDFVKEACIKYPGGGEDILFLSKFRDRDRKRVENRSRLESVLRVSSGKKAVSADELRAGSPVITTLDEADAPEAAEVFRKVFKTYPFPIFNPGFLIRAMRNGTKYFSVKKDGRMTALASAELDRLYKNAEMTDFAVLPEHRGEKLSLYLLERMHREMRRIGIDVCYTIARAVSYGMNSTFAKLGYEYTGTLVNNTNISGSMESMNVWCRRL